MVKPTTGDIYKMLMPMLVGALLSGAAFWLSFPRNVITKDDLEKTMPGLIAQYSQYSQDAKNISTQLQALHDEQLRQGASMSQMAVDVGRISEKVGVSAHPTAEQMPRN